MKTKNSLKCIITLRITIYLCCLSFHTITQKSVQGKSMKMCLLAVSSGLCEQQWAVLAHNWVFCCICSSLRIARKASASWTVQILNDQLFFVFPTHKSQNSLWWHGWSTEGLKSAWIHICFGWQHFSTLITNIRSLIFFCNMKTWQ